MRLLPPMASLLALLAVPVTAPASYLLDPESVCAPTDTVCVIDTPWTVLPDEVLDFGSRRVVVRGDGRLTGNLTLLCGSFDVEVDGPWMQVPPGDSVSVTARGSCSGDASVPCLSDGDCASPGLGTCRWGNASITLFGSIAAAGNRVQLTAADTVTIAGPIDVSGLPAMDYPDYDAGYLDGRAVHGSVVLLAPIFGNAGADLRYGGYGAASDVWLAAGQDISIRQPIHLVGGSGSVELTAGRDVAIRAPIFGQGADGSMNWGAGITADAGRDIVIEPPPGIAKLPIRLGGGSDGSEAGSGGNGELTAGCDIRIAEGVRIRANSGPSRGFPDNEPFGGWWVLDAGGDLRFDGRLFARGRGNFGMNEGLEFYAGADLSIGPQAKIDLRSDYVGTLQLNTPGHLTIEGRLDARAHDYQDEDGYSGTGGSLELYGGDIDFLGTFVSGGGNEGGSVWIDACRLHLGEASCIDSSFGTQDDYSADSHIEVGEHMVADAGSVLAIHGNASMSILYRDAAKPPLLQGTVPAGLEVKLAPWLSGCPVCGNGEIDEGEDCDDGNLEGGDGCDESCLVQ